MVGDNWTDVESGHAAGFRTAFCAWGYGVFHDVRPDVAAETFPGLIRTITGANK